MSVAVSDEVKRDSAYAHQFSLYNQLNFQITLGTPMILYAKSLGASSTTIGIVAALAPLLTVLQLPTAYFIPKVGYKRFVLLGWFSRTLTGFSLALLPLVVAFLAFVFLERLCRDFESVLYSPRSGCRSRRSNQNFGPAGAVGGNVEASAI